MEGKKWMPCWCRVVLAILIIVWVWWWTPSWANWAITVAAAIIGLISLSGKCCCADVYCLTEKKAEAEPAGDKQ